MKEESGRRNYEEESSGRQAFERHLGGIWRHLGGKGPQEVQRWSWKENVPKPNALQCLSSRPAVSLGFWRGDRHEVM